jgi:hypothetical protein
LLTLSPVLISSRLSVDTDFRRHDIIIISALIYHDVTFCIINHRPSATPFLMPPAALASSKRNVNTLFSAFRFRIDFIDFDSVIFFDDRLHATIVLIDAD